MNKGHELNYKTVTNYRVWYMICKVDARNGPQFFITLDHTWLCLMVVLGPRLFIYFPSSEYNSPIAYISNGYSGIEALEFLLGILGISVIPSIELAEVLGRSFGQKSKYKKGINSVHIVRSKKMIRDFLTIIKQIIMA